MKTQPTIEDSIAAVAAWEDYRDMWLQGLKLSGTQQPTKQQIDSMREVWLEGWFRGRLSK